MKSLIRLVALVVCLSGWAVASLALYFVRVPDPGNPQESRLVVVPKNRLTLDDTYTDARAWTMSDVNKHPLVVLRLLRAGKADELKFLADPKSKKDVENQIIDALSASSPATMPATPLGKAAYSLRSAGFGH